MATLLLRKNPDVSPSDLTRKLTGRLLRSGIQFHTGTIGRQLSGFTLSVPIELENAMLHTIIASNGMRTSEDVERALLREGLQVPADKRLSPFLPVSRTLPLYHLWLHLHPTRPKKDLANRLHKDLAKDGIHANAFSIPSILEGRRGLPRREILGKLLAYLSEHGIRSEAEALALYRTQRETIRRSVEGRGFVPAQYFVGLCRAWQILRHEPELKSLARRLHEAMSGREVPMALAQYQKIVDGHFPRVRRSILWAMEELVRKELPQVRDLEMASETARSDTEKIAELKWVQAGPIAQMARTWVSEHPQGPDLAVRVYKTVRRMGYPITLTRVRNVLNGRQKKTRGFIYRAMLKQFGKGRTRIPAEHRIASAQILEAGRDVPPKLGHGEAIRARPSRAPELELSIQRARRYLRTSTRSDDLLADVLAFRIAERFEIPREEAMELLLSKKYEERDPEESSATSASTRRSS